MILRALRTTAQMTIDAFPALAVAIVVYVQFEDRILLDALAALNAAAPAVTASDARLAEARGVVVLGGGDTRVGPAAALANRHPEQTVILSGAADRERAKLERLLVDRERLVVDTAPTSTFENATSTRRLLGNDPTGCWTVVTSDYHLLRAAGTFQKAGFEVLPVSVTERRWATADAPLDASQRRALRRLVAREYAANLAYRLLGWSLWRPRTPRDRC